MERASRPLEVLERDLSPSNSINLNLTFPSPSAIIPPSNERQVTTELMKIRN